MIVKDYDYLTPAECEAALSALDSRWHYGPSAPPPQIDTLVKRTSDMDVSLKRTRSGRIITSSTVSSDTRISFHRYSKET